MRFPVVLHTDDGTAYGVTVPDLPGCFSAGDTLDEALDSALEAIDLHVQGLLEDGQRLPAVQPLAVHQANPDYQGAVFAVVDAPVERYLGPAEKLNITLPRLLLAQIDDYTASHNLSRSGFLAKAAIAAMRE